jgi:predicted AlkP superfamily pyrophosphatase or phosphodiesterase
MLTFAYWVQLVQNHKMTVNASVMNLQKPLKSYNPKFWRVGTLLACTQNATSASDILKFWFSHLMFFIWDDLCLQVKDTVQVDHNVSRHLDFELAATDWDLLVLHYLGLDHVGHLGGRSSPLMPRKLKEMDAVVQKIHQSLIASTASRNTLLLVGSDHGMTDGGNHGGASYQETDSLALFISGKDKLNPSCDLHPQILSHSQHPNMGLSILRTSYQTMSS